VSHIEKVKDHDLDNISDNRNTNFKDGVKHAEIKLVIFFKHNIAFQITSHLIIVY